MLTTRMSVPTQLLLSMRHRPMIVFASFQRQWNSSSSNNNNNHHHENISVASPTTTTDLVVYKGPFNLIILRLKGVSLATATMSSIGIPFLMNNYSGEISSLGQYAVGGVTVMIGMITTLGIHHFFGPYVHSLERIPVQLDSSAGQKYRIKSTRYNIFLMRKEMVFDPSTDCEPYRGNRPFCNFLVKNVPHFIHPESLLVDELRKDLLGEEVSKKYDMPKDQRKSDADEVL
jgi:hypothetical protein